MSEAVSVLARHGRSFRLAGRLLPGPTLGLAAELYAFCRAVDDLADEAPDPVAARGELLALRRALLSDDRGHPLAGRLLALHRSHGVSPQAAVALVDTVLLDLGPVRLATEAELLRYAYGVAGTVGLMMCAVLDARSAQAAPHAIDLGIAMQLTNIARDVTEDAARGRVYLPAAWLPAGLTLADMAVAPEPVFAAVRKVLEQAGRRYRSAELGYRHLPARVRPAIRAAARLYEEIGRRILRRGPDYLLAGRCVVPMPHKLALLAGCFAARSPSGPHDARLHEALCGMPGAHA